MSKNILTYLKESVNYENEKSLFSAALNIILLNYKEPASNIKILEEVKIISARGKELLSKQYTRSEFKGC